MSLFFQPGKRFSNELRSKRRKGAEYRRLLANRKRQEPLPGAKKLLHGEDEEFGEMLEELKRQRDAPAPCTKEVDLVAMVLSCFTLLVLFAGVVFRVHEALYAFALIAFVLLHVVVIAGQSFGRGANRNLLLCLFVVYGGLILWVVLLNLNWLNR